MSKVMIDMEIPKSCSDCALCYYDSGDFDENLSIPTCPLLDCEVDGFKKHKNCPLQEVREEENIIENETGGMTMAKLKPCPFCGGIATLYTEEIPNGYSGDISYIIECTNCEANIHGYDTEQQAIDAWNRRRK